MNIPKKFTLTTGDQSFPAITLAPNGALSVHLLIVHAVLLIAIATAVSWRALIHVGFHFIDIIAVSINMFLSANCCILSFGIQTN